MQTQKPSNNLGVNEKKGIYVKKEKIKLSLFTDDIILHIEKPIDKI